MHRYIIRRLLLAIPTLLLVSLLVFSLIRIVPGDAIMANLNEAGFVTEEQLQQMRAQLGLDKPFHEQYFTWLGNILQGDPGLSLWSRTPIIEDIKRSLPVTLELGIMGLTLAMLLAIPLGVISAIRRDSAIDYGARFFSILGLSLPDFWIGTSVILLLVLRFNYFPQVGYTPFWDDPLKNISQFIIPALIIGYRLSATSARMTRSTMLEVLREDYIRTAWAKGLRERAIIIRHALKNAMIPVITLFGGLVPFVIAGSVIMETLFGLPGMGRLTYNSIVFRDYTVLQANVMLIALIIIVVNLLVDISYAWLDPRIRYR